MEMSELKQYLFKKWPKSIEKQLGELDENLKTTVDDFNKELLEIKRRTKDEKKKKKLTMKCFDKLIKRFDELAYNLVVLFKSYLKDAKYK